MFKFNVGEQVKIQVFNKVTSGMISMRTLSEDATRSSIVYTIKYSMGIGAGTGEIEVGEDFLVETQLLEIDYE